MLCVLASLCLVMPRYAICSCLVMLSVLFTGTVVFYSARVAGQTLHLYVLHRTMDDRTDDTAPARVPSRRQGPCVHSAADDDSCLAVLQAEQVTIYRQDGTAFTVALSKRPAQCGLFAGRAH